MLLYKKLLLMTFGTTLVFSKYNQITSSTQTPDVVGAELFRAEGQTDKHKESNSRLSEFCESA